MCLFLLFCCFFFFGYFVRREKRSAIIPLISFSLFFPENIRGILLLVTQQALPILRRDCNDLRAGRKETWEGDLPGFLPTKKEPSHHFLTHSQLFARILFVIPVIYLFVFLSFPLFFLLLLFPQELWLSGKDFPVTIWRRKGLSEMRAVLAGHHHPLPNSRRDWVSWYSVVFCVALSRSLSFDWLSSLRVVSECHGISLMTNHVNGFDGRQSRLKTPLPLHSLDCNRVNRQLFTGAAQLFCVFLSISVREKHREIIVFAVFFVFWFFGS